MDNKVKTGFQTMNKITYLVQNTLSFGQGARAVLDENGKDRRGVGGEGRERG